MRATTSAAVGARTNQNLSTINVAVAFLGTNGISHERGLTTPNPDEAAAKHAMLAASERRILLADHSKFGQVQGEQHATLDDLDVIITDQAPNAEYRRALDRAGVELVIA
jgi:DeoR family fructose operon transcriptional repressor